MDDVAVAWSTGKDAALALQTVAADPGYQVVELFTTVTTETGTVRGHDVPRSLLARQADTLGYPLRVVDVPDEPDAYERHLRATFDAYDRRGIDRVVYADLFVEPIREYRESLLADHDRSFLADLTDDTDPCGENGEFHTFVRDGPLFASSVPVETAGRTTRTVEGGARGGTYHYCDLRPADG